ncbi:MAG: TIGR00366 family protein [Bryobacterales bacterium]
MSSVIERFGELGEGLSRFTERWVPNSWAVCMLLTAVALALAVVGAGAGVEETVLAWGGGMWSLLELAMQFTIIMVMAHACVASRPVYRWLDRLALLPNPAKPRQAVAVTAVFSMLLAYVNWALALVAGALFVPFLCRRNPKADVRVVIAAAYLGGGTVFGGGLSSSAPLILATPGNPLLEPSTGAAVLDRLIPVTTTLFSGFNLAYTLVIGAVGLATVVALHPRRGAVTLSNERIEAILPKPPAAEPPISTPADWLDAFPGWIWLAIVLIAYPLGHSMVTKGFGTSWTINAYNMVFLIAALLLHRRPMSFLHACREGVGATWGIILQFPFYAGIFGVMNGTGLGAWLGALFASSASTATYPLVVYVYSAVLNLFVPSAGSKWLIEAPYLIPAAEQLRVSIETTVLAYAYGDSTTNLIQPFWAIPILSVTGLRFGEMVGYTSLVALVCFLVSAAAMLLIPAAV